MKKNKLYTVNKWNAPAFMPAHYFAEGDSLEKITPPERTFQPLGNSLSRMTPYSIPLSPDVKGITLPKSNPLQVLWGSTKESVTDFVKNNADALINGASTIASTGVQKGLSGGLNSGVGNAVGNIGRGLGSIVGSVNPLAGAAVNMASSIIGGGINAAFGTSVNQKKLAETEAGTSYLQGFNSNEGSFDAIQGPAPVLNVQDAYRSGFLNKGWARKRNNALRDARTEAQALAYQSVENNAENLKNEQTDFALRNYAAFGGPLEMLEDTRDMGAINYGFMSDYLTMRNKQAGNRNNPAAKPQDTVFAEGGGIYIKPSHEGRLTKLKERTGKTEAELWAEGKPEVRKMITFARNSRKWKKSFGGNLGAEPQDTLFALGGVLQTHGADWGDGLSTIDAGGSHEENPYEGVQIGTDREGIPNLVEEGEVIYDDYVYSNRIYADEETLKKFHLPRKKQLTYAEIAKKLEKEGQERPNDPISKAGFKVQMEDLAEEQERQKQEIEAQRAKEAFDSLSPEEQVALMEGTARQEQAVQEGMALGAEPQDTVVPEIPQEQLPIQEAQVPIEQMQELQMQAYGGRVNKFDDGGEMYKRVLEGLGFKTEEDFLKWVKDNDLYPKNNPALWDELRPSDLNPGMWNGYLGNIKFLEALKKRNPSLADAVRRGYLSERKAPKSSKATIQSISRGNWKATDGKGWRGSEDLAFKQATAGLTDEQIDALTTEQLEERMRNTDAYRNTSRWLEDADNALLYFNTLLEDADTPEAAKEYARKYVENGQWKDGVNYSYREHMAPVRESSPGTYWHSVVEATPEKIAESYVYNDDTGEWNQIIGEPGKDWTLDGTYNWIDTARNQDNTLRYYRRPSSSAGETEEPSVKRRIVPNYQTELFGVEDMGPLTSMAMMSAGIGRPNYTGLDKALSIAETPVVTARPSHISGYYTYRPLDPYFEEIEAAASNQAAQRAVSNSALPTTNKNAATIALDYNYQNGVGQRARAARQYNNAERMASLQQQKDTDKWNAQVNNEFALRNAGAYNDADRYLAGLNAQIGAQKMEADAGWNQNLYGNVQNIYDALGARSRENRQMNMIADMAAAGVFGNINPDNFNPGRTLRWETDDEMLSRTKKKSRGGKLNNKKRRGLTF